MSQIIEIENCSFMLNNLLRKSILGTIQHTDTRTKKKTEIKKFKKKLEEEKLHTYTSACHKDQ